jgi:hypothetical protein
VEMSEGCGPCSREPLPTHIGVPRWVARSGFPWRMI